MANETMTLISTVTVGAGGIASLDLQSIPQTYTDLYLVISARTAYSGTDQNMLVIFNNDTGNNYSRRVLSGNGSSASSVTGTDGVVIITNAATSTANTFSSASVYIPNYTGSTYKSASADAINENNATTAYQTISATVWNNTAAINRVTVSGLGQTIVQYSTASLYGILKGSGGATVS